MDIDESSLNHQLPHWIFYSRLDLDLDLDLEPLEFEVILDVGL